MALSHKKLSGWYHQLAQQLEAGLPLIDALRSSAGAGVPAFELESMARRIEQGGTLDDALRATGPWLPYADRLFISAAAEAGRLPRVLHNLSDRHAQFSSVKARMILACAYPLAVLHLGLILFPLLRMIDWQKGFLWDPFLYARMLACTLLPLWCAGVILAILLKRQSPLLIWIARLLPALRSFVLAQALADFAFALGNFLEAGLPIEQAWPSAGLISRSPDLMAAAQNMEMAIARGEAPGAQLEQWKCFPADFASLYRSGESTGQLEQNLLRLAAQNQESANHWLKIVSLLYPALLFLAVMGIVAYHIIVFYAGYLKMLGDLAN